VQRLDDATGGDAFVPTDGSIAIDGATPLDAASGGCAFTGTLASWTFAGALGSQAMTAASASASGVTASGITRSAAIVAASGADSMNANGWPTSAQLDPTSYYTLSIAPPAGCTLAVMSLAIDAKASGTGPASAAVATSADAFAQRKPISTAAPSTPTIVSNAVSGNLEIRIYGYAATGSTGTMRLQNQLSITGSVQ